MAQFSVAQNYRYEITRDTVKKQCHVFQIDDFKKTFSVYKITDCKNVQFFINGRVMVRYDSVDYVFFKDLTNGNQYKNIEVCKGTDIKKVLSIETTTEKYEFWKNTYKTTESLYRVRYIHKNGNVCEMLIDQHWFMTFEDYCK